MLQDCQWWTYPKSRPTSCQKLQPQLFTLQLVSNFSFPDFLHFPWLFPDHFGIPWLFQVFQVSGHPEVKLLTERWWTTATATATTTATNTTIDSTTTNTQWCSKYLLSRCADYVITRRLMTDLSGASMAAQVCRLLWRSLRSMRDTVTIIRCTMAWLVVTVTITIIIAANCWMSFKAGYTDRHINQQVCSQ